MPVHVGADSINPLQIGSVTMSSGYVGADKVYGYSPSQILTLPSGTDFDLKAFIDASGALYTKPIIINMASDQVIGGVSSVGLNIEGLPTHETITMNINGQVQAHVGGNAMASDEPIDIISVGEIAGGVVDSISSGAPLITIVLSSTGKILAGGGNGGNGGLGGQGDNRGAWSNTYYNRTEYGESWVVMSNSLSSRFQGGYVPAIWGSTSNYIYKTAGGNVYNRVAHQEGDYWSIRASSHSAGVGGIAGIAGKGAGYGQVRTNGSSGGEGTYRSGKGGKGGDGGDWGIAGSTGESGGAGLYYSRTTSEAVRSGAAGGPGGSAGYAIVSAGSLRIFLAGSPQAQAFGL